MLLLAPGSETANLMRLAHGRRSKELLGLWDMYKNCHCQILMPLALLMKALGHLGPLQHG